MIPSAFFTLPLLAEAAAAALHERRRGERLAEAAAFLALAAALCAADLAQLAAELAGAQPPLFSLQLTEELGIKISSEADEMVAGALAWSQVLAIASSIAFTVLLTASIATGGTAVVAASLAQAGLGTAQAVANAALSVAMAYRFAGQIYLAVARVGGVAKGLLPLGGGLMVPRATRRLGATLLAVSLGLSLVLPAALNSAAWLAAPRASSPEPGEVGVLELEALVEIPLAGVSGKRGLNLSRLEVPAPPGLVVVYRDKQGRTVARPTGRWFLERTSTYTVAGAVYGTYWLPIEPVEFEVGPGIRVELACEGVSAYEPALACAPLARNFTLARFRVAKGDFYIVPFRSSFAGVGQPRGWGLWLGRGFFVLAGSERWGSPLWWYNVSGYLGDHEVVAVLDPLFCDSKRGYGRPPPELGIGGAAPNATVEYLEATAWIEGDIDAYALCADGRPRVLDAGESVVEVNGTLYRLRPELRCEVSFVEPRLPDARDSLGLWFDQFARVLNASLPPSALVNGSRRCLYGNGSRVYAIVWNGKALYPPALWPHSTVPRVVVTARYYGNVTKPAVVGPAPTRAEARGFSTTLDLVSGLGNCSLKLALEGYDTMDERVVAGLAYDSAFEGFLSGGLAERVRGEVRDIAGCVSYFALLVTVLIASAFGIAALSSALGGVPLFPLALLRPLRYPLAALEGLGSSLAHATRSLVQVLLFRGAPTRMARGTFAAEAFSHIRQVQRELEGLRRLAQGRVREGRQKSRAKRVLGFALGYSDAHPIPFALRLVSEIARREALRSVPRYFPYAERLRIALMRRSSARLLLASDVAYALAWVLDAKPLTAPLAARFVKMLWREYRLINPKRLDAGKLGGGARAELESSLAKLSRELLRGRVSERGVERARVALAKAAVPPAILRELGGGLVGGSGDLEWKVALVAAALDLRRQELLDLARIKPQVALRLADLAALDRLRLTEPWKAAVFEGLSKLEARELGLSGAELACVWLSSLERDEKWRYLALRLAFGREAGLPQLRELPERVVDFARALAKAWGSSASAGAAIDLLSDLRKLGGHEERLLRGFADAAKGLGVSLEAAVEAFVASGDPYWAGYALMLAVESGSVDRLVEAVTEAVTRFGAVHARNSITLAKVRGFLERTYRELSSAIVSIEGALLSLPTDSHSPEPGFSLALSQDAAKREMRVRERLVDLLNRIDSALRTIDALTAEAGELELRVRVLGYAAREWYDALLEAERVLASARARLGELKMQVRSALKMLK